MAFDATLAPAPRSRICKECRSSLMDDIQVDRYLSSLCVRCFENI